MITEDRKAHATTVALKLVMGTFTYEAALKQDTHGWAIAFKNQKIYERLSGHEQAIVDRIRDYILGEDDV